MCSNLRVDLSLPIDGLLAYKSASQRARVSTEAWGAVNLFCPSCSATRLNPTPRNHAAIDYYCPSCQSPFQLKSQSKPFGAKIVDAAYSEMKRAILEDKTPNLFILHYDLAQWLVRNVILIPRFAFSLATIECRTPLALTARRAGWIGCNILLGRVPQDARISIVRDGIDAQPGDVRRAYRRLQPLETIGVEKRGWTLDVLTIVRTLGETGFSLQDVYAHANALKKLHPHNAHVHEKIRQQLQVLRDLGLLEFLTKGRYRLR
jgi:type II restriction enzyme